MPIQSDGHFFWIEFDEQLLLPKVHVTKPLFQRNGLWTTFYELHPCSSPATQAYVKNCSYNFLVARRVRSNASDQSRSPLSHWTQLFPLAIIEYR